MKYHRNGSIFPFLRIHFIRASSHFIFLKCLSLDLTQNSGECFCLLMHQNVQYPTTPISNRKHFC